MPNFDFGPIGISEEEARTGFEMTNPMMTEAYSRSMPSWVKRLQERLRQGGMASRDAQVSGQRPMMQEPDNSDPMTERGQALQQSYNQGRQIGQLGRSLFGGG